MRLAIISDIHSNLAAFEAVLDDIAGRSIDQVILNGDVINAGPQPLECLNLAYSTGYTFLLGNHERYIRNYDLPERDHTWDTDEWKPSLWTALQLGLERRQRLHGLAWAFEHDGLLVVHASRRNDNDSIFALTPDQHLADMFPDDSPPLIIRSHNHMPQFRPWNQRMIVSTGAVGLPLDGNPLAKYAIVEQTAQGWQVKHRAVAYDLAKTKQAFYSSGFYDFAYPMSYLYLREVLYGTHHVVPFIRLITEQRKHDPNITSEQALRMFMEF